VFRAIRYSIRLEMKNIFTFLILLACYINTTAQTSDLDELPLPVLKEKLSNSQNDTTRVQLQLAIGHLILFKSGGGKKEIDSALTLASDAAKLSSQLRYNFGIINAQLLLAESFNGRKQRNKGLHTAQQALNFALKNNNPEGMARAYLIIGQHYDVSDPAGLQTRMAYNDKAIEIFRKERIIKWLSFTLTTNAELLFLAGQKTNAIKLLFETLNLGDAVSRRTVEGIYWLIGRTSTELSDYPNALKYNLLAIKTAKEVGDTTLQLCSINHTMAVTYIKMQDYNRALPYSLRALEIARHYRNNDYITAVAAELAVAYTRTNKLPKAINLLKEVKTYSDNDLEKLNVAGSFLSILTYAKQFKKAETYAAEVQRLLVKVKPHNFTEIMNACNFLGYYYLETGQPKKSIYYTDRYAEIARNKHFPAAIRTAENRYYKLDSINGDYKSAINHYLAAQRIKDSVESVTKAYQISLLQIENETEQKNNDIDTLTKQAQIKDAKLKSNQLIQNTVITVSVLLLIITALIYSRYRLKQKTNQKLELNQRELDQKNLFLETLTIEQQKLLKEKVWLIKEVHHRVKNNLQMVTSLLRSQSVYLKDDAAVLAIKDSLRRMHAMSLIHQKLYQDENTSTLKMPDYISDLVRYLHDSFDTDNQIRFEQNIEAIALDVSQAIPLGLIITESVVNAIKYAFLNEKHGTVSIYLQSDGPDYLLLKISDNGQGLPEALDTMGRNSLGMDLMQGLAKQLKGTFRIENNNGVQICVRFLKLTISIV